MPFFGFPYPTRMALVRLSDGSVWIWSPIALTDDLARAVDLIGRVRYIVSPNKLHHLFLREWSRRWPDAKLFAPPGLAQKKPDLRFEGELGDEPDPNWASEIDQVVFRGSLTMEEVVFRDARQRVLDWKPLRLLIAHGECASSGASRIIAAALSWI